jgi:hypothetical protein
MWSLPAMEREQLTLALNKAKGVCKNCLDTIIVIVCAILIGEVFAISY